MLKTKLVASKFPPSFTLSLNPDRQGFIAATSVKHKRGVGSLRFFSFRLRRETFAVRATAPSGVYLSRLVRVAERRKSQEEGRSS